MVRHVWRGSAVLAAIAVMVLGLQAGRAFANDISWVRPYQNTAFPFGYPLHIAADPTGLYVVGWYEPDRAVTELLEQKYSSAGNVISEGHSADFGGPNPTGIAASGDAVYETITGQGAGASGEVFLRKRTQGGGVAWTEDVGRQGSTPGVAADASGAYVTWGIVDENGFVTGARISHYNTAGFRDWTHPIGQDFVPVLGAGDNAVYLFTSDDSFARVLIRFAADGTESWRIQPPIAPYSLTAPFSAGGIVVLGSDNDGHERLAKYAPDGTVAWSIDPFGPDRGSAGIALAADDTHIYMQGQDPNTNASFIQVYDTSGNPVDTLDVSPGFGQEIAIGGGYLYLMGSGWPGTENGQRAVAAIPVTPGLSGRVTWSDAYPDRVGQGVAGATVNAGGQTFTTDAQGNYTLPPELEGQQATVELPLFDYSGAGATRAASAPPRVAGAPVTAAGTPITAKVSQNLTLTIDPSTGKVKGDGTFGKNVSMQAFGQTVTLTNVRFTDQGLQTVGGTTQLSFKYDANSPPITLNTTISYVKSTNQLTITGTSGTTFQWGGQTATLNSFEFKSPQNTVTMAATINLSLSQVAISAQLTGTGTADGVTLQAKGQADVSGITVFFDPITVESGQFHVKGHVKLPNQPIDLAFDTTSGFSAPRLILPLPQFQWDGQVIPMRIELLGTAMILAGEGNVQLGGQSVRLTVDTQFNALNASVGTVKMNATLPLPDGEATARLEFDPSKPQNSSVTGTLKIFLALCPSRKTDFNVTVQASSSAIKLGFHTQLPVDCDGDGTSTLVDINGDFDGQLATLAVSWPVTVGNVNGRVSATVKGDGTYFEILFNAELKFGPGGGRSSSPQAGPAAGPRAADVRVLLTDSVGRRTGYDAATGQILNEIPGGHYDGFVNGMDSFTMPGVVGGYAVTLSSATAQSVQVVFTVNGQPTTYTAQVTPTVGTTLAAETVPQNGTVGVQVNPMQVGCAPRPAVHIAPVAGGGALQATFAPDPGTTLATNAIREIRIGQVQNGTVDAAGRTGLGAGGVITFPSPVTSTTLIVRRVTPGQATTVPLTIVDACGTWQTFVGGGPSAF